MVGITTINGVEIKSFATHFIDRTIGQTSTPHANMRQGTPIEYSLEALTNGAVSKPYVVKLERGSECFDDLRQNYTGARAQVAVSLIENRLIQANIISK